MIYSLGQSKVGFSESVACQANLFYKGQVSGWTKCIRSNSLFQLDMLLIQVFYFNLRWKRYASRGHDIPGNLCCPLGRSVLGCLLQIIVQVADDSHGQKPEDVKFLPVLSLER